jgi:hypothetical protein
VAQSTAHTPRSVSLPDDLTCRGLRDRVAAHLCAHRGIPGTHVVARRSRCVYTAMAFSHYSSQVESKLDAEARLMNSGEGRRLIDELIRRASGPRSMDSPLSPDDLERRGATSSFFTLLYIAARERGTGRSERRIRLLTSRRFTRSGRPSSGSPARRRGTSIVSRSSSRLGGRCCGSLIRMSAFDDILSED